jgi:hypothetical protein
VLIYSTSAWSQGCKNVIMTPSKMPTRSWLLLMFPKNLRGIWATPKRKSVQRK